MNSVLSFDFVCFYRVISDYAAMKWFVIEMEKSAAAMAHYDAKFGLASIFWFIPCKIFL